MKNVQLYLLIATVSLIASFLIYYIKANSVKEAYTVCFFEVLYFSDTLTPVFDVNSLNPTTCK